MKKLLVVLPCLILSVFSIGKTMDSIKPVTAANQLKQLNNNITTSILAQWDRKKVNSIKLNTISKGIISFTNSQINTLRFIAGQCELSGGNAVPEARIMLALNDSLIGNYNSACDIVNYRKANSLKNSVKDVLISPNPNNGYFKVDFNGITFNELNIYDYLGRLVLANKINNPVEHIDLSTVNIGIYTIHFARNGIVESIKKISIIK